MEPTFFEEVIFIWFNAEGLISGSCRLFPASLILCMDIISIYCWFSSYTQGKDSLKFGWNVNLLKVKFSLKNIMMKEFNNRLTNFKMKMIKYSSNTEKLNDTSVLFIVTMCMYTCIQISGNIKILGTQSEG